MSLKKRNLEVLSHFESVEFWQPLALLVPMIQVTALWHAPSMPEWVEDWMIGEWRRSRQCAE